MNRHTLSDFPIIQRIIHRYYYGDQNSAKSESLITNAVRRSKDSQKPLIIFFYSLENNICIKLLKMLSQK